MTKRVFVRRDGRPFFSAAGHDSGAEAHNLGVSGSDAAVRDLVRGVSRASGGGGAGAVP